MSPFFTGPYKSKRAHSSRFGFRIELRDDFYTKTFEIAYMRRITPSRCVVETRHPFAKGSGLFLRFWLSTLRPAVEVSAAVTHTFTLMESLRYTNGIVARFQDIDSIQKETIKNFTKRKPLTIQKKINQFHDLLRIWDTVYSLIRFYSIKRVRSVTSHDEFQYLCLKGLLARKVSSLTPKKTTWSSAIDLVLVFCRKGDLLGTIYKNTPEHFRVLFDDFAAGRITILKHMATLETRKTYYSFPIRKRLLSLRKEDFY